VPFLVPRSQFDPLADNFSKLSEVEEFRHERTNELIFMMRWRSGSGGRKSIWAQKSNPLTDDFVRGFRPIRLGWRRSVPLRRSPDLDKALIVGGHPMDGEGAFYAIGHRLLKRETSSRSRWFSDRSDRSDSTSTRSNPSPWGLLKRKLQQSGPPDSGRQRHLSEASSCASAEASNSALVLAQSAATVSASSSYDTTPPARGGVPPSPPFSPPDSSVLTMSDVPVADNELLPPTPSFASCRDTQVSRCTSTNSFVSTPVRRPDGADPTVRTLSMVPMADSSTLPPTPSFSKTTSVPATPSASFYVAPARRVQFGQTADSDSKHSHQAPELLMVPSEQSTTLASSNSSEDDHMYRGLNPLYGRVEDIVRHMTSSGRSSTSSEKSHWSDTSSSMSHDVQIARAPARTLWEVVFDRHSCPPPLVELYCLNPHAMSNQALRGPSTWSRLRSQIAAFAVLRQREMERHHAYERTAARPYKHDVLLQQNGVKRLRVSVQRQWLLQYPDGKIAFFVLNPKGPPIYVPVLRVIRDREAFMNLRLMRRGARAANEPMHVGGRYNTSTTLLAEYELVRTDGRVLVPEDIVHEPLALHDEIGKLKRAARKKRIDPIGELHGFVSRLPRKYHSVGVRVYNPTKVRACTARLPSCPIAQRARPPAYHLE
jgi:hypothetical protein